MIGRFKPLRFLVFLGLLAACDTTLPPPYQPEITFEHQQPIKLKTDTIEVVDAYKPPYANPNVEHKYWISPAQVGRKWADDRLAGAGGSYKVKFEITDASVIERPIDTQSGVTDWFLDEESRELTARLEVRLIINDGASATARVAAEARTTLLEQMTLNEVDRAYFELLASLAAEFDRAMTARIGEGIPQLIAD
jgi:hypothetical protein